MKLKHNRFKGGEGKYVQVSGAEFMNVQVLTSNVKTAGKMPQCVKAFANKPDD